MADTDRKVALEAALALHSGQTMNLDKIRKTAETLASWLGGTKRISLTPGTVADEGAPAPGTNPGGNMQINTGQKISYTADTEDASGFDTAANIEWSVDDPATLTLIVSEDTRTATVVSGAPGSTILTAKISELGLLVTEAIDVVPAGTATIKLVAGFVEDENPAPAEEEPTPEA